MAGGRDGSVTAELELVGVEHFHQTIDDAEYDQALAFAMRDKAGIDVSR